MTFEGWWVDSKTGKGYHVAEHWLEVKSNPERFGLTNDTVSRILKSAKGKFSMGDTSYEGQRGKLLIAVLKNGWVRVRELHGTYSIQLYDQAVTKLKKVIPFLKRAGVGPYSQIFLHDVCTNYQQVFKEGMSDLVKAIKAGQIPEGKNDQLMTDKQKRVLLRQKIGQEAGIESPSILDDRLEEKRSLAKGFKKILG